MSNKINERKKVVILGGSIAAISASLAAIGDRHPTLMWIWLGLLGVAALYVIYTLIQIKKSRRSPR